MLVVAPTLVASIPPSKARPPLLQNGDTMSRLEFERRSSATPETECAELIEGVVHMPPPVAHEFHSRPSSDVIIWLGTYRIATPHTDSGNDGSLRLDMDNMPQPDAYLLIDGACGGQSRMSDDGFVEGAPELVCEISASTVSIDLHAKLNAYRRNGVKEYIVWRTYDRAIDYFILRNGEFVRLDAVAGTTEVYHSEIFPGLRLDAAAMLRGDLKTVLDVLQQGIATQEHAAFAGKLQAHVKPE